MKIEQKNYQQLEIATNKMKYLTKNYPHHFKTQKLGKGMSNYTTQLERDIEGKRRRNPVFKRGTLVYVDFGINYGSEFSSYHYAIILSNDDSRRSNTITVVPLTSKKGNSNIKLDTSISLELAKITSFLIQQYVNSLVFINETSEVILKEFGKAITKATKNADTQKIKEIFNELSNFADIQNEIKNLTNIIDSAQKRVEKYTMDLNKDTYIKIDAITTIDKNKIFKRKDDLDPLTKTIVSTDILKLIDEEIANLLLTRD